MSNRERGNKLSLEDLKLLQKKLTDIPTGITAAKLHARLQKIADEIPISLRYLKEVQKKPAILAGRIRVAGQSQSLVSDNRKDLWPILEAARLMSWPVTRFIEVAEQYYSRISVFTLKKGSSLRIASDSTYRNHIYRLWALDYGGTVRALTIKSCC